ncbi:uncharacterized protein LOC112169614 [Rosa chinensis]|uniref:uncharacterized protein LOC112169614 n=1 Tax=Rosa chinensis TaxID=74649 RepID=UPI000D0967EC|nr:uncharacterized protein LOC112169614 [Rosa chinensis]
MLANRSKEFLPSIISPFQSAFVPGRQIQDNILVAHEAFHYLKLRKNDDIEELALKLDMSKAYDRSVSFSMTLNGKVGSYFKPSRGLRQGDPISPYLFLFISKVISSLIQRACECTPNISDAKVFELCEILGVPATMNPGRYLELPTIWGRLKKASFSFIKARLTDKIQSWKLCTLSMAGRETFINSVAQAVPTFPMHCFNCQSPSAGNWMLYWQIFWWGQKKHESKIHWRSWQFLGQPKHCGGLGFRNLSKFNIALLAKQVRRIHSDPTSLCALIIKGLYYPNSDILHAGKDSCASWAWSSLLDGKALIVDGARWQVRNGETVDIWVDRWITGPGSGFLRPILLVDHSRPHKVKDIIDWSSHSWCLNLIQDLISIEECNQIEKIVSGDHKEWGFHGQIWLSLHSHP